MLENTERSQDNWITEQLGVRDVHESRYCHRQIKRKGK